MPQGFSYSWTGLSLEELQAGGTSLILFGLGTLVVYLTLSAQYESFVLPFIVLLAVPMALLGALGAQWMRGLQNDVFCQVGLVMLVGLSSKNAILIVEFAEQLRGRGMPLVQAAVQAATIRLRPILMTSLAFILGVVPLVVATGAGENGRHSVGTTVFGGMIMSTILNLFFIPVLYLIIEGWREHGKVPVRVDCVGTGIVESLSPLRGWAECHSRSSGGARRSKLRLYRSVFHAAASRLVLFFLSALLF